MIKLPLRLDETPEHVSIVDAEGFCVAIINKHSHLSAREVALAIIAAVHDELEHPDNGGTDHLPGLDE